MIAGDRWRIERRSLEAKINKNFDADSVVEIILQSWKKRKTVKAFVGGILKKK